MSEKLYLYPTWVRIWHLMNAILCLLLIISGISMQYSNPEYPIIRFDLSVKLHDIGGIILVASYFMFLAGNVLTSNGDQYLFRRKGYFKKLMKQARYYAFGIFGKEDPPFAITSNNKFNPLQRFSYVFIMYLSMPIVIITGLMLLFPDYLLHDLFGTFALHFTDIVHVIIGFIISLFMIVHLYFCTIGKSPLSNFRSIITGYHEKH